MTAATASRQTMGRIPTVRNGTVDAAGQVYLGCMVQVNAAGFLVAATATAANKTIGVSHANAGPGESVNVENGRCYAFNNSAAGDLIAKQDIGSVCYVVDDNTVAKTSNSNARPVAGKIYDVDEYGVWVDFR